MRIHLIGLLLLTFPLTTAAQSRPSDDPLKDLEKLVLTDTRNTKRTTRQYDRFENRTRYWTLPTTVREGLDLAAQFSFKGQGAGHEIEGFYLSFQSASSSWRFLKHSRLICLIDGKSFDFGVPVARDNDVKTDHGRVETQEFLMYSTSLATLTTMANAKTLEMRLGTVEFTVGQDFRDAVRELTGKVQAVKKPRKR